MAFFTVAAAAWAAVAVAAVGAGVGFVQAKKAAKVQSNLINSQAAAKAKEIKRQIAFEQDQLEQNRRVQRLNADMAEAKRQKDLRVMLARQIAGSAGRFDVMTSRSAMALVEDTIQTAELDIDAIRLGADISEQRNLLEAEEIQRSGEAGVSALRASSAASIVQLDAAVRSTAIAGAISTVGAVAKTVSTFQNIPKAPTRIPSPTITPRLRP